MIFNSKYLDITDKEIIKNSFDFLYKELFQTSNDFDLRLLILFKHIFNMPKEKFIESLQKYGNSTFYNREEIIYERLINAGASTTCLYFFKQNFKRYVGEDCISFNTFMSCFYIEEEYIEELSKEVENSLENLKDEMSFSQYLEAYKTELKYMLENYAIKKEAIK